MAAPIPLDAPVTSVLRLSNDRGCAIPPPPVQDHGSRTTVSGPRSQDHRVTTWLPSVHHRGRDSRTLPAVASTALGSKPQCAMQLWQRGSRPRPYFDQSVVSMSSL